MIRGLMSSWLLLLLSVAKSSVTINAASNIFSLCNAAIIPMSQCCLLPSSHLTTATTLLWLCVIWRVIFPPAMASGELGGQSKPWELIVSQDAVSSPSKDNVVWGALFCSLKCHRALEECFGSRNLLSSPSTKNSSKSVFVPCGTFALTHRAGEVPWTPWVLLHHWQW